MMSVASWPSSTATSAGAPLGMVRPIVVGVMLAGFGTGPMLSVPTEFCVVPPPRLALRTTAGKSEVQVRTAAASISELRRLSGFTWDQLARLFHVSRRSLHFWASGKPMTPANEEHLQRLLAVVRKIDRGTASSNRAELLAVRDDGTIPFDLLADGHYDRLVAMLGTGPAAARRVTPRLSDEAAAARAPRPPEELVGGPQGGVHRETTIARAAKSVRVRSGR
jgi:DNA-binding transcriptional regulator YiaG